MVSSHSWTANGVFGAVCIHGLIFGLMNIAKGEALAYSITMIDVLRQYLPHNRLVIAYDICCKIKTRKDFNADDGFVSAMHSYNHNDSCRSRFCPKRLLGFGCEDGEDCERLWSYIRAISYPISVMRVENREDILSLVCAAYNEWMTFMLVTRIRADLVKCVKAFEFLKIFEASDLNNFMSYQDTENALKSANSDLRAGKTKNLPLKLQNLLELVGPLIKNLTKLRKDTHNNGNIV